MLIFLLVLLVIGLLIVLGVRVCLFLYRGGALRYRSVRRSRRKSEPEKALVVNTETEEALARAETEYLSNLVHSLEQ